MAHSIQAVGWKVAFFMLLSNLLSTKPILGASASAGELICILSTGAMQWNGRTCIFLVTACEIVQVQDHPSIFMTFLAWCLAEVIRYPFYALNTIGACILLFIVLYPTGLIGEMWLLYRTFPCIKEKNIFAKFFAMLPVSYYNLIMLTQNLLPIL